MSDPYAYGFDEKSEVRDKLLTDWAKIGLTKMAEMSILDRTYNRICRGPGTQGSGRQQTKPLYVINVKLLPQVCCSVAVMLFVFYVCRWECYWIKPQGMYFLSVSAPGYVPARRFLSAKHKASLTISPFGNIIFETKFLQTEIQKITH